MMSAQFLREFGYTQDWIACGVVDEVFLREQYAEYCRSDDKHQEHYRYRAFASFLARQSTLSDDLVDKIFSLTDAGPDGTDLSADRIIRLIASGLLTDEQHGRLGKQHPRVLDAPVRRQYLRESLRRKIRKEGIEASFAEIQESGDSHLQLEVLDHPEVTRSHLEWLKTSGSSRAIRNRATQLLGSRRFKGQPTG
jgi:hypothetical protein